MSKAPRGTGEPGKLSAPSLGKGSGSALTVACFGELLWDSLPSGLFLGGAPVNAAYHLARQGLNALPITAVGRDLLGDEARRRIERWGVSTSFVARLARRPSGTVHAKLDTKGIATYEIARRVAWDHIEVPPGLQRLSPVALVYGTLALREPPNRTALATLLGYWPDAWRVVDLNLRSPFDRSAVVRFALKHAQMVKLNDDELSTLTGRPNLSASTLARCARSFAEAHDLARVCVTAGARGAGLWWDGEWYWEDARPVEVRDTVGAGDAFLGALLGALIVRRASPRIALAQACRMGEFVASRDGATPAYHLARDGKPVAD